MKYLALFLLTGCAHRPATRVTTSILVTDPALAGILTIAPDRPGCDLDQHKMNYWLGSDGLIGFGLTCEQAYQDWKAGPMVIQREEI